MNAQDAKQLAIAHLTCINAGDIAGAAALMADDCINHAALPEVQGRNGFVTILEKVRAAFPDLRYAVEDTVAEGDRAVLRVTLTGTQTGTFAFTRLTLPATGKPIKFEQIHIVRAAHGKIVEHWMAQDSIALFRQLGVQIAPAA